MLNFTENQIMGNKKILEKEDIFDIFKKENGIEFILQFLKDSPLEFVEANKVFLKILQNIIDREIKNSLPVNSFEENTVDERISEYFNLIIFSIEKFEYNNSIIIYLLDIIKTIISNKKLNDNFYSDLLDIMYKLLYNTNSAKIAANGFHILDMILKNSDHYELMRNKNSLNLVVRILTNFRNDNIVSFHACGFLSKVLEREDVNNFLKIMKIKNVKNLEDFEEFDVDSFLPEIKDILSSEDNENKLNSLKKNIIRVLILMSKDKNFLQLLKDINCLDIFVKLLKSDLEIIELKNNKITDEDNNKIDKQESKYEILERKFNNKGKKFLSINGINNIFLYFQYFIILLICY